MKYPIALLIVAGLTGCVGPPKHDSIDSLVANFGERQPLAGNGIFRSISLPENSKPEEVVRVTLLKYQKIKEDSYTILEVRKVMFGNLGHHPEYTAARVKIKSQEGVVLFRYLGGNDWFSEIY